MKNIDDAVAAADALRIFTQQFGSMDDPYNRLVLEILIEELFGVEIKEKKDGNKDH